MSHLLCVAVEHCGPERLLHSSREVLERTLTAVVQLVGDSAPEARWAPIGTGFAPVALAREWNWQ